MTNTTLLKDKIKTSGLKQNFIAKSMGLSSYGLCKKINNETEFKTSEVGELCKILNISDLAEKDRIFFANSVDL